MTEERRKPDTVVTSENLAEFQAAKLDLQEPPKPTETGVEPEIKAVEEPKTPVIENPGAAELAEIEENSEKTGKAKQKLSERMHELAEKAKTEKAKREEAERKAEASERRAVELEAKLKPAPEPEIEEHPKPTREQFTDAFEYAEKLADWSAKNALRERDKEEAKTRREHEQQQRITNWTKKVSEIEKSVPDFKEKVAASTVIVSNEVRDAILESDIGPKILLHLAENPAEADKISQMTVGKAYIALGKLEAKLGETKPDAPKPALEKTPEISKAPAPITPLKGANAPADLPAELTSTKTTYVGTNNHAAYVEARRSGKIK